MYIFFVSMLFFGCLNVFLTEMLVYSALLCLIILSLFVLDWFCPFGITANYFSVT